MQHDFMPGNVVTYPGFGVGEVIARGASRGKYWVQVLFADGRKRDVVNEEIKKLKRS
jgi:hypothetical protein